MLTLGLNATFHDCSASIVRDGTVLAAVEEERFTRIKHGKRPVPFSTWQLPYRSIDYCLAQAGCELADVDHIVYAFDPSLLKEDIAPDGRIVLPLEPSAQWKGPGSPWDGLFLSYILNAPRQLVDGVPLHVQKRFRHDTLQHVMDRWQFLEHHLCHEASAFMAAPYEEAAVLTMDGRGERTTTSYGLYAKGRYDRIKQVCLPHSLGLLYEEVTRYLGFLHSSDEYKVMALASYGKPAYLEEFRRILQYDGAGGYTLHPGRWVETFGPARVHGAEFLPQHMDIAHSLQKVLEETVLAMAEWLHQQTQSRNLCMAGGVALNCVLNSHLANHGPFDNIWVQPAAGDAGTSLGAALWVDGQQDKAKQTRWFMDHAYLGPDYGDDEIDQFLTRSGVPHRKLSNVARTAAELLADEKVIGWFQGRMEFGPRALGGRSILASPRSSAMQARLNELKDREDFRPVAPVVLAEKAQQWFDSRGKDCIEAPFMLFVFDVLPEKAALIPAVRHTDGTARVQTVSKRQNPLLHELLSEFEANTGVPVLVNTSFNTRGEPVVCSPRDALESFWTSPLDALLIGRYLVEKTP
ncbi:carbamoyltransferase C-terminal domain-containing protein [Pusillimonas sp. SM2304]|uniref:carbamoyltransferase family protein n=1 Tax=Pusillimonas sp. SM2304 TaxID=3073241 RepID=UPI002876101B|nr:carbamoyltransferase C-terminal domain-containing protein [Pusillimonas sp. SM2304]MDS1139722.1 carbamoyltransferase C-terminal domain-containing protein [Pusillimonas sp. SM2304]